MGKVKKFGTGCMVHPPQSRDYVRWGAEGALAPPEFGGSDRRTEGETDTPLLIAPSESKS